MVLVNMLKKNRRSQILLHKYCQKKTGQQRSDHYINGINKARVLKLQQYVSEKGPMSPYCIQIFFPEIIILECYPARDFL